MIRSSGRSAMPCLHKGWLLRGRYEKPIVEGRKKWEGRAVGNKDGASEVRAGDTVEFVVTTHSPGWTRRLSFRVAEVKRFASCKAMLQNLGIGNLLPDCKGGLEEACKLYEEIAGNGKYAAWLIDRKSLRVQETKAKPVHWTRQVGMVQPGVEQPRLGGEAETLLERFGKAMVAAGHQDEKVLAHKDRLRYCARQVPRGLWPLKTSAPRGDDDKRRAMIKAWPVAHPGYLCCSFNWLLKFVDRQPLTPRTQASQQRASRRRKHDTPVLERPAAKRQRL